MHGPASIVIPCFNAGDHLLEALASAEGQTYPDIDIVIVDDGSTDPHTRSLLDRLRSRVTVLRQANAGPAAARNAAIAHARGEYILPLDADDRISPSYVEKAVQAIQEPGVGIVYCRAEKFGDEVGPWTLPAYDIRELAIDNVIFVSALFRKRDWKRVGGFGEHLRKGVEDYDFWVKLVHAGCQVRSLDESLFHYRVQNASRTTRFKGESREVVDTYARIFRDNIDFYSRNAEVLFEHRFELYRQIHYWRARYGWLDALATRFPAVAWCGSRVKRALSYLAQP